MRLTSMLRISPAVWISPVLVFLAVLHATTTKIIAEPYAPALTALGASSIFLIGPVCAACAAWEGGRLRRAEWTALPHVRSRLVIALESVLPILLVGGLAVAAAIVTTFLGAGAGIVGLDLSVVAVAFAVIGAQTLLGFALGLSIPVVVAVPAVLVVGYAWMVLPIAVEPLWLRHLTGVWRTCCQVSTSLAPQAVTAALIVAAGLAGSAVVLLYVPLNALRIVGAIALTLLGLFTGSLFVRQLGPDPVIPRDPSMLVCTSNEPRVCVWPEHRQFLEEVVAVATQASKAWQDLGINVPDEFSEQEPSTLAPGKASFGISLQSQRADILSSLAYSMVPPAAQCEDQPFLGGAAGEYLTAWFAHAGGLSQVESEGRFQADVLRTVNAVRSLPLERQQAWLERNLAAWQACDLQPQLEPTA